MLEWRAQRRCALLTSLPVFLVCLAVTSLPAHADTKVLTAEATYTMGEGETMTFAEAMALQKAKQVALEQAGTYVESYTKVQNYQLTADEIQTVAGGVLQVEVLDKKRELVGDGLKFFVKIKATVITDKVLELAERIKDKNVSEEYKKLQEDYARLSKEVETWKQLATKTPAGPEREAALEQIREREKAFAAMQKHEVAFFQRLVSGESLVSKALEQLSRKENDKSVVEALFLNILNDGHVITIGEPDIRTSLGTRKVAEVSVPVSVSATKSVRTNLTETAERLGGRAYPTQVNGSKHDTGTAIKISEDLETLAQFELQVARLVFVLDLVLSDDTSLSCFVANSAERLNAITPGMHIFAGGVTLSLDSRLEYFVEKTSREIIELVREDASKARIFIFDSARSSTIGTTVSLGAVKGIKAIRGRFVQGTRDKFGTHFKVTGLEGCVVK